MLIREIKDIIMLALSCFFMFACSNNKHEEAKQKRSLYKKYSLSQVGLKGYNDVWNAARDSIKNYVNNHLSCYAVYADCPWYLDSLICFNKEADRCMMALSYQHDSESPSDGMDYFHGAKTNGKWYFFLGGGNFVLPRDYYQSDVRISLNIEQFNKIAIDNIFSGYLKKNKAQQWEINDAFFIAHFENVGWGDFDSQSHKDTVANGKRYTNKKEYFESIYLRQSKEKWLYRDTL